MAEKSISLTVGSVGAVTMLSSRRPGTVKLTSGRPRTAILRVASRDVNFSGRLTGAVKFTVPAARSAIFRVTQPATIVFTAKVGGSSGGGVATGGITASNSLPTPADGVDGDWWFYRPQKAFYEKSAGAWTFLGKIAKEVTNAAVVFVTPTAGDGEAALTTV